MDYEKKPVYDISHCGRYVTRNTPLTVFRFEGEKIVRKWFRDVSPTSTSVSPF